MLAIEDLAAKSLMGAEQSIVQRDVRFRLPKALVKSVFMSCGRLLFGSFR
jgi:hypothetical protein